MLTLNFIGYHEKYLIVIIININEIPEAFDLIFRSAFATQAAVGGFTGATIMMAMRRGVARVLLTP